MSIINERHLEASNYYLKTNMRQLKYVPSLTEGYPFTAWHKRTEKYKEHELIQYHQESPQQAEIFTQAVEHLHQQCPLCWIQRRLQMLKETEPS